MGRKLLMLACAVLASPSLMTGAASADGSASATITVKGTVGIACHLGDLSSSSIDVGTLSNSTDGTLAPISGAPNTSITGSWCNTGSRVAITASPLVAQGFAGVPSAGFTKAVNYTATASGWGSGNASDTTTGNSSGVEASTHSGSATVNGPEANTITVSLSAFATPSGASRLVADDNYQGTITVTLTTTAATSP